MYIHPIRFPIFKIDTDIFNASSIVMNIKITTNFPDDIQDILEVQILVSFPNCLAGDMNGDGGFNVLDVVTLANCVLNGTCTEDELKACAADMNGDGGYNVLDIVTLANCVLNGSCSD